MSGSDSRSLDYMVVSMGMKNYQKLVLALCFGMFVVPSQSVAEEPRIFPLFFTQSGFVTDDPPTFFYATYEKKKWRAEVFSLFFNGTEIGNYNIDSQAGREDVRELSQAMKDMVAETGRPFVGFWHFPRLPGFFWPEDVALHPDSYRAKALKSDGSLWVRYPLPPEDIGSKIAVTGDYLDITNRTAVDEMFANIARVFDHDGDPAECIGPLYGFIMLDEHKVTRTYSSVWSQWEQERDVDDPMRVIRLNHKTHHSLFLDDDPYYSFLNAPKRAIPLYSQSACDSFISYAAARGYSYSKLPADRLEFNDDDSSMVPLPSWVQFVDLSDTQYWTVWEDWVYETWTKFIEEFAREMSLAQQGNPDFLGVIYFQLPSWYSLRTSSQSPVTFQYLDENDVLQTETIVLADYPEYDRLNPVSAGVDMDYLMQSPWFAGMVHETTKSIHVHPPAGLTYEEYDEYVDNHDRYIHYFMAQGALAREVCHDNGKLFCAFARSQFFKDQTLLTPEYFDRGFDRTIKPLRPDVISTIGPWFVDRERLESDFGLGQEYYDVMRGEDGELQDIWVQKTAEYRAQYRSNAIVQDTFTNNQTNRQMGDSLVGTTAEIGGVVWEGRSTAVFSDTGYITNVTDSLPRAAIPFDLDAYDGKPITIEADVNLIDGLGDSWVSLGFMQGTGSVWESGRLWMLVRRDGRYTVFAHATVYKLGQGQIDLAGDEDSLKNAVMRYDPVENTVEVWINGNPITLTTSDLDNLDGGNGYTPTVTHVGFTTHVVGPFQQADAFMLDNFKVALPEPPLPRPAANPGPADQAKEVSTDTQLSWTPGEHTYFHHLYLGTDPDDLTFQFQGNAMITTFDPPILEDYTTYYWRIDEVNFQGVTPGPLWSFTTTLPLPHQAADPVPSDTADDLPVNVNLTWNPGQYAFNHHVYFSRANTPLQYRGDFDEAQYDPGPLEPRTAYHWRVDEVNDAGLTAGAVWTFNTGNLPGDFDGDDDVDLTDFGLLQSCLSVMWQQATPDCQAADLDGDQDVDQFDLARFLPCISGTNIPADPACADNPQ